ncbi:MAG: NADP-dependent malic enzyme [Bacteroidetes bacterium]|jgi:malate dehydrogenase (oxaloacetate-decarboxylating)|nr:NADP-dependent malic enzyme [Bacteroidota bacterium]
MDYFKESLNLHESLRGKIGIQAKMDIDSRDGLSLLYSPGVAEPCKRIHANPNDVWKYTIKSNMVAVVTDGTAVLGLGNIGASAALPVMEGKAMLFKKFGNVDAFPICLDTQDTEEVIETIRRIAPVFGGINLEDISAPRCFEIEDRLQDLGIPVFHDDQHGTAVVVLAGIINACKLLDKNIQDLKIVINGAGAAGVAIAKLLDSATRGEDLQGLAVKEVILCDTKGVVHAGRTDLNDTKRSLLSWTNPNNVSGSLRDVLKGADVFIGVSQENLLNANDISTMAKDAIIFALANPVPEIMPEEAYKGGAAVVGTGRSDLPNQINNVLAFPGIFRGALDGHARRITTRMKIAAALAIAESVEHIDRENIVPETLDMSVGPKVAKAVIDAIRPEDRL